MELTISATEFKAKCLELFDRLNSHALERVVVTKRGKPVSIVTAPVAAGVEFRAALAALKGSVVVPDGLDLTAPAFDEEWDAEKGMLHR
jgi:antitoxin (DNA-binding transcriptional repressor) of toxin-antitoxin stability system